METEIGPGTLIHVLHTCAPNSMSQALIHKACFALPLGNLGRGKVFGRKTAQISQIAKREQEIAVFDLGIRKIFYQIWLKIETERQEHMGESASTFLAVSFTL